MKEARVPLAGLAAALFYAFTSIGITFFNKAVLTAFEFKYPNTMTLFQMLFSLLFLSGAKLYGLVSFPDFSWEMAKKISPLSISFIFMVMTGLAALGDLNIPMFSALRRATTLITLYGEWYVVGTKASGETQASVWAMVAGAVVAALYDLDFNLYGYVMVTVNCVFTALYLIYIAKFKKSTQISEFELMFYNNLLSAPLVAMWCLSSGEFNTIWNSYAHLLDTGFLVCFIFQGALAFFLNYSIFLCTRLNSALTTSVTGQIKNILTTFVGYFIFGDVHYDFLNVVGLLIGVVASVWYGYVQYAERQRKNAVLPTTHPTPTTTETTTGNKSDN